MRRTVSLGTACVITFALAAAMPHAEASPGGPAGFDDVAPNAGRGPAVAARLRAAPAPRAGGAVVVGTTAPTTQTGKCSGTAVSWVQKTVAPGVNSYVVPGAGVISSVSHFATPAETGAMRAEFLDPGAGPDDYVVRAFTPLLTTTPGSLNTFPVRIPVAAGTRLGLFMPASNLSCAYLGAAAADVLSAASADPSTTSSFTAPFPFSFNLMNLSAVWEPDVDGDGYGDVSQDACPQSKLTQSACPAPDTTVTKRPEKRSTKRKVKIKFSSTIPGSTFTCAVDGKATVPCTSPFKKRFKVGRHIVSVTATSPAGIVEATPAKVKFKVVRPTS